MNRIILFLIASVFLSMGSSRISFEEHINGNYRPRSYKRTYNFIDVYTEYNRKNILSNSKDLKYSVEGAKTIEDLQTISLYKIDSIVINRNIEGNTINNLIYLNQTEKIIAKQIFSSLYFKYKKNNEIKIVKFPTFYLDKIEFNQ